jgi:hypothetical protein
VSRASRAAPGLRRAIRRKPAKVMEAEVEAARPSHQQWLDGLRDQLRGSDSGTWFATAAWRGRSI